MINAKKLVAYSLFGVGLAVAGTTQVDAATVLGKNVNITGTWTAYTQSDGTNTIKKGKEEYILNQNSSIHAKRDLTIDLNNSDPIVMDKILADSDLTFKGEGAVIVETTDAVGIEAKAQIYTKENAHVKATAYHTGIRAKDVYGDGGKLEGLGNQYGIYSYGKVEARKSSVNINGVSALGIGIYGTKIYTDAGDTSISGEGMQAGLYATKKADAHGRRSYLLGKSSHGTGIYSDYVYASAHNATVKGEGFNYGVAGKIKVYAENPNGHITGIAHDTATGIGVAGNTVFAKGGEIIGKGYISGIYGKSLAKAENKGARLVGVSYNINSGSPAVNSDNRILDIDGGVVREEYINPGFLINTHSPLFVTDYKSVAKNMTHMKNYIWYSEAAGVYLDKPSGGLLLDTKADFSKVASVTGYRNTKYKEEAINMDGKSRHEVVFKDIATNASLPVKINYHLYNDRTDSYELLDSTTKNVKIGTDFKIEDNHYDFDLRLYEVEVDYVTPAQDFTVEYTGEEIEVNYYYVTYIRS